MIRKAVKQDIDELTALHFVLIKHLKKENPSRYVISDKWKKSFVHKLKNNLNDKDAIVIVDEEKGKIRGFGIGRIKNHPHFVKHDKFGEITEVVVETNSQRKGIGSKISKKILEFFKKKGIKSSELFVDINNKTAINTWKKLGFEETTKGMIIDI